LAAASGQMLRHSPGATMKVMGRKGTRMFQKKNSAPTGRMSSAAHRPKNTATLTARTGNQARTGTRRGISV
jgi:hypothetical protein